MSGSKPKKPKILQPAPPPKTIVEEPEIDGPVAKRRRKGIESTILADSLNQRNNILRTGL